MNTKLDIAKILTLSTAHIKPETATMLDNEPNTDNLGLSVYDKARYGWFIYIDSVIDDTLNHLPEDLKACIAFAKKQKCEWLCLDADGEEIEKLTIYQ